MGIGVAALVIAIIGLIVGGGLVREYIKTSKEHNRLFGKELTELKERMDQLETDMAEQKELVADTIIDHA